jgi:hypothetical protein
VETPAFFYGDEQWTIGSLTLTARLLPWARPLLTGGCFREDWTHEAHFVVLIYLLERRPDIDLDREIGNLWRRSNEALGIENNDTGGYHETITRVYLNAVRDFLANCPGMSLVEICNSVLTSPVSHPLEYYEKETLFSPEARRNWLAPDMKNMPRHWRHSC